MLRGPSRLPFSTETLISPAAGSAGRAQGHSTSWEQLYLVIGQPVRIINAWFPVSRKTALMLHLGSRTPPGMGWSLPWGQHHSSTPPSAQLCFSPPNQFPTCKLPFQSLFLRELDLRNSISALKAEINCRINDLYWLWPGTYTQVHYLSANFWFFGSVSCIQFHSLHLDCLMASTSWVLTSAPTNSGFFSKNPFILASVTRT